MFSKLPYNFKTHMFNAMYLSIFLYGARRIFRKIRPITMDDANDYLLRLPSKNGDVKVFLVHRDGTYYHVATTTRGSQTEDAMSVLADIMSGVRGWKRIASADAGNPPSENVVWNVPMTKLLPPEKHRLIPMLANRLRQAYRENN